MLANCPWSGYYHGGKNLWVFAHTTQFTRIGWQYLDNAYGYLPGGSYVTLKSPDGHDFTTVIETTDATGPQVVDSSLSAHWVCAKLRCGLPT